MKQKACEATGADSICLDKIKGLEEYYCGIRTTVYGNEGSLHTVERIGVVSHPGLF